MHIKLTVLVWLPIQSIKSKYMGTEIYYKNSYQNFIRHTSVSWYHSPWCKLHGQHMSVLWVNQLYSWHKQWLVQPLMTCNQTIHNDTCSKSARYQDTISQLFPNLKMFKIWKWFSIDDTYQHYPNINLKNDLLPSKDLGHLSNIIFWYFQLLLINMLVFICTNLKCLPKLLLTLIFIIFPIVT